LIEQETKRPHRIRAFYFVKDLRLVVLVRQFLPYIHDFRLAVANNGGIDLVNSAGFPNPHADGRKMKPLTIRRRPGTPYLQVSLERRFCGYRGL
jgi:hypothetical protein